MKAEPRAPRPVFVRQGAAVVCALLAAGASAQTSEPLFRYTVPIEVTVPAPFLELTLPAAVAMRSQRGDLSDLRIVDALGRRTPYAWLPPETRSAPEPKLVDAPYFALPARGTRTNDLPAELEVISTPRSLVVKRRDGAPAGAAKGAVPGWLVDLGPSAMDPQAPAIDSLHLRWPAGTHFMANYRLDTSADLRQWHSAGSGTLLALESGSLRIAQAQMPLPATRARFIRWTWDDPASVPTPTRVQAREAAAPPTTASPREAITVGLAPPGAPSAGQPPPAAGTLDADLGGVLPLTGVSLQLPTGTHVLPVRVQRRDNAAQAWTDAGSTVFYRFERDGLTSEPPPFELRGRARFIRLLPDARAGAPEASSMRLTAHVELPRLVWAQQGTPPFQLQLGAAESDAGALPLVTLVPGGEAERSRFGRSTVGAMAESARAAEKAERDAWLETWRPALLWGVLLAGVSGLGFMIWRLARGAPAATRPPRPQ